MSDKKFYKTTIPIVILSEGPLEYDGLDDLHYLIDSGPCVGQMGEPDQEILDGKAAADALYELGSDPSFFDLDEYGNDAGEY